MGQISAPPSSASSAAGAPAMAGSLLSGDGTLLGAGDPLTSPFSGLLGSLMADLGSTASQAGTTLPSSTGTDANQAGSDSQQGVLAQFLTSAGKATATLPDAGQLGLTDPTAPAPGSDSATTGGSAAFLPTQGLFPPMSAAQIGATPPLPATSGPATAPTTGGTAPLDGQSATDLAAQQAALSLTLPSPGKTVSTAATVTATADDTATSPSDSAATGTGGATDLAQQAAAQAALAAMMPQPQQIQPQQPSGTAAGMAGVLGNSVPGQMTMAGQPMGTAGAPPANGTAPNGTSANQPAAPQSTTAGQTVNNGSDTGFALPDGLSPTQADASSADTTALNALAAAVKNPTAAGATANGTSTTGMTATPVKGVVNGDGTATPVAAVAGKPSSAPAPGLTSTIPATTAPSLTASSPGTAAAAATVPVGGIGAAAAATGGKIAVGGIGASGSAQGTTATGAAATAGATTGASAGNISGPSMTGQDDSGTTQDGGSEADQSFHDTQTAALLDTLTGARPPHAANTDASRFLLPGQTAEAAQAAGGGAQSLLSSQQTASGVDLSKSYIGGQGRVPQYPPTLMQVSMNLQKAVQSGADTVTVQLKPDDLGSINVRLSFEKDGRVKANITADNVKTLDMLQRNSGDLQKSLQSAGIKTDSDSLSFSLQDDGQSGQQQQQARPQKNTTVLFNVDDQSPEITPVPEATIAASGRVDVRI